MTYMLITVLHNMAIWLFQIHVQCIHWKARNLQISVAYQVWGLTGNDGWVYSSSHAYDLSGAHGTRPLPLNCLMMAVCFQLSRREPGCFLSSQNQHAFEITGQTAGLFNRAWEGNYAPPFFYFYNNYRKNNSKKIQIQLKIELNFKFKLLSILGDASKKYW